MKVGELSAAERLDWLRLIRCENVGPVTFHRLLERYGAAEAALAALPGLAQRGGRRRGLRIASRREAEAELAKARALNLQTLAAADPAYPPLLRALPDAPPIIHAAGHLHLLQRPAVAIVGARNASAGACQLARRLAEDLAAHEVLVVSGLARGVDTAAHRGALEHGTAAVLAGGADVIYPRENADLHADICARGVLYSERPPGAEPLARHFPHRNRLISGMCHGTVVVEAGLRSGSLITARTAAEQGREVFAVPGSPLDPRTRGANQLIRDGATLVESAQDVLQVLRPAWDRAVEDATWQPAPPPPASVTVSGDDRDTIIGLLGPTPVATDELVRQSGLGVPAVLTVLLELELAGRLSREPGQNVSLPGQ